MSNQFLFNTAVAAALAVIIGALSFLCWRRYNNSEQLTDNKPGDNRPGAVSTRRREITVKPLHGGKACPALIETKKCEPVDCQMGDWIKDADGNDRWVEIKGGCDKPGGMLQRSRPIAIHPKHGGKECLPTTEEKVCAPRDCETTDWGKWETCKAPPLYKSGEESWNKCTPGYGLITTEAKCWAGAKAIDPNMKTGTTITDNSKSKGCFYKDGEATFNYGGTIAANMAPTGRLICTSDRPLYALGTSKECLSGYEDIKTHPECESMFPKYFKGVYLGPSSRTDAPTGCSTRNTDGSSARFNTATTSNYNGPIKKVCKRID